MMNEEDIIFEFYTSYPPSINNYYVRTQRGTFISQKGKKFRAELLQDASEQLAGIQAQDEKLRVDIVAWVPDNRIRDMDNIVKPIFDAMTHANLWDDDCQVDQHQIYRGAPKSGGALYIRVSLAGPVIPVGMEHII